MEHNSKAEWRTIGDKEKYFRSNMEANYARTLQFLKECGRIIEWEHEPETFYFEGIKRGTNNYKPDFKVIESKEYHYWVEVKGYYDAKSITKIKRFKKYFPNEKLILIDKRWFLRNNKQMKALIKDWE